MAQVDGVLDEIEDDEQEDLRFRFVCDEGNKRRGQKISMHASVNNGLKTYPPIIVVGPNQVLPLRADGRREEGEE